MDKLLYGAAYYDEYMPYERLNKDIEMMISSMGGWRWEVFVKSFIAGLVLVGIPIAISCILQGRSGDIKFTVGGFVILTLLASLQGLAGI